MAACVCRSYSSRARCGVDILASLVSLFWRAATASAKTIASTVSDDCITAYGHAAA